jgi:hypothetical protein
MIKIKTFEDLSALDVAELDSIDTDKLSLGTEFQDCMLIANTFEKAAHSTPTEAATFATVSRTIQNTKQFSRSVIDSMETYLRTPEQSGLSEDQTRSLQSLNIGNESHSTLDSQFGEQLLDLVRDCIPCEFRLQAFMELAANANLLSILEGALLAKLNMLQNIGGLLKNIDIYSDLCGLLNMLSFMCVPDLQRIIATLMALFILEVPKLDGLIGVIQILIAPIFTPVLMGLLALLDQFVILVTNPLECVIRALNFQLRKLSFSVDLNVVTPSGDDINTTVSGGPAEGLTGGIAELSKFIAEAKINIELKLKFYIDQIKALTGEIGNGDIANIAASLRQLKIIRLIAFVAGMITAVSKGQLACSAGRKPPELSELDNFFENFVNPNSPFNLWIDNEGNIRVDEKLDDFVVAVAPSSQENGLPNIGNVFQFEGQDLVDPSVAQAIDQTQTILVESVQAVVPCRFNTTTADANKVNQFIAELNQL